jgi:hypothetical protein
MPRPIRTVLYFVLLLLAIVWLAARDAPPASDETVRDVTEQRMEETLASLRADVAKDGRVVIVLGDSSMLWHLMLGPDDTLASLLEREAERVGLTVRVVAHEGFDPVAYYLLVDAIAALRPEAVVLTANLQAFTDSWFRHVRMKHPQLAAFVRPGRVLEAIDLPLELAGITDASLVVKPALRVLGASDLPETLDGYRTRLRARLDALLTAGVKTAAAGAAIAEAATPPQIRLARRQSVAPPAGQLPHRGQILGSSAFRFMDLYPMRLDRRQATVRVLAATVRDLVARDVRTIVLIAPLHLQALRGTGAYARRDLAGAVRVVSDAVVANGGIPVDLTSTLPEESYFTDRYTHFTAAGNRIVADQFLDELRRIVTTKERRSTAAAR